MEMSEIITTIDGIYDLCTDDPEDLRAATELIGELVVREGVDPCALVDALTARALGSLAAQGAP